jgi:hypothetical protein
MLPGAGDHTVDLIVAALQSRSWCRQRPKVTSMERFLK